MVKKDFTNRGNASDPATAFYQSAVPAGVCGHFRYVTERE